MQRKIVRMICFKRKFDTITKFFSDNKILTVHELYVYDLMKFCLRSLNQKHPTCLVNSLFTFKNFAYTRISEGRTFVPPFCKNKVKSCSLTNRGSKLLNIMNINKLLPEKIGLMSKNEDYSFVHEEYSFVHKFEDNCICCNYELVQNIFLWIFIFEKWYPLVKCYQTAILGLRFYAETMTLQILVVFEISQFFENFFKNEKT